MIPLQESHVGEIVQDYDEEALGMKWRSLSVLSLVVGIALIGMLRTDDVDAATPKTTKYQQYDPISRRDSRFSITERRAAAKRLKGAYIKARHEHMFNANGTPKGSNAHGYSGVGRKGDKK